MKIIVTCEHGGNRVPARFREQFRGRERLLNSHRGYDKHALAYARHLARRLGAQLFCSTVTRLLIDLNRSPGHPGLFSRLTGGLGIGEKEHILREYYLPYRRSVESAAAAAVSRGDAVLHISVHSFAPVIRGETKRADIGLLYDPSRSRERSSCLEWQRFLQDAAPALVVRRNYPYRGRADGLVTSMRKIFSPDRYTGIELELNQGTLTRYGKRNRKLCDALVSGVKSAFPI